MDIDWVPGTDPRTVFPDFYGNPTIKRLAKAHRWSVSTFDKKPVDMGWLLHSVFPQGAAPALDVTPPGARSSDPSTMATLDELATLAPDLSNLAFYLDASIDGVAVVDIEPHAPAQLKAAMLDMDSLYREVSMSGRGYHLVIPIPQDLLDRYPDARKSVVKDPSGDWEVHMMHWVTFTRDTKGVPGPYGTPKDPAVFLEPLFRNQRPPLVGGAQVGVPADLDLSDRLARAADSIVCAWSQSDGPVYYVSESGWPVSASHLRYHKTPYDFARSDGTPDMSRYEFGALVRIVNAAAELLSDPTDDDLVKVAYDVAQRVFEARDKHATLRSGVPYLLMRTVQAVEAVRGDAG